MKLHVVSDVHLEWYPQGYENEIFKGDKDVVLIIAGDFYTADVHSVNGFLETLGKKYKSVIFVPGNHDYYSKVYQDVVFSAENVFCPNHDVRELVIDDQRFVCGTLWGDGGFTLHDKATVANYLYDFRAIKFRNESPEYVRSFTINDMVELSKQHRKAFTDIGVKDAIVVSHYLPSRRLVHPEYWPKDGTDGANGGFVSDCENLICTQEPKLWIYGHTHKKTDTVLWKTRMVCNPMGYPGENKSAYSVQEIEV